MNTLHGRGRSGAVGWRRNSSTVHTGRVARWCNPTGVTIEISRAIQLNMNTQLLPCPFCGHDSQKNYGPQLLTWTAQNGRQYHAVRCNCDVMQTDNLESVQGWKYKDEAVEAWNTRNYTATQNSST